MNDFIQEKKSLLILLLIIAFLLIGLFYFYQVMPIQEKVQSAKFEVHNLENDINILHAQLENAKDKNEGDGTDVEQMLPTSRNMDQFLLSLYEVEKMSNSKMKNISFSNLEGDFVLTEETNNQENAANSIPNSSHLKTLTVQITVHSPSYQKLQQFIQGIENLERITKIDNFSFSEQGGESITATLQLTTFYYQQ